MFNKISAIKCKIMSEIEENIYPVNSKIPSRNYLCKKYKCSRSTIDRVLQQLIYDGFLCGRQGSGTFVKNYIPQMIERLFVSYSYTAPYKPEYIIRDRFFNGASEPWPLTAVFEEDVYLYSKEIIKPRQAMIWDCPSMNSLQTMDFLAKNKTPQIIINRDYADYNFVATDQDATMHDGLEWLIAGGGKNLALVSYLPDPTRPYMYERLLAFFENALISGAKCSKESIFCQAFKDTLKDVTEAAKKIFCGPVNYSSIAVLHYDLANIVVSCGLIYNKYPGRDYQLFCFDYVPELLSYKGVCLVKQRFDLMYAEVENFLRECSADRKCLLQKKFKADLIINQ